MNNVLNESDVSLINRLSEEMDRLRAVEKELENLKKEVEAVLQYVIPPACVVRACEGGGPENLAASLALSVIKLTTSDRAKTQELQKVLESITNYLQLH